MRIRAIDRDGDWQWGLGRQDYRADSGALEQDISTKIRSWLNDCFFAMDEGIDWSELLGSSKVAELKRSVANQILKADGTIDIAEFQTSWDRTTRRLTMDIKIYTIYGDIHLKETL